MKRTYAFEADASTEVKDKLEEVEKVVDEKCESVEDCEKLEEKIESTEEKFNDALQGMADAAKEGGDKDELKEKIDPHMTSLKEIAKDMGVATESEVVTDQELKDVKSYIEGAKEIVEAKKDELEGECTGDDCEKKDGEPAAEKSEEKKEDSDDDDKDDDDECDGDACEGVVSIATESFIVPDQIDALEAYLEDLALESEFALEGYNSDLNKSKNTALKAAKAKMKEAKAYAKQGDVAATKAAINECVTNLETARSEFNESLKAGKVSDAVIGNVIYSLQMILVTLASALVGSTIGFAVGSGATARAAAGAANAAKHASGTIDKAKAAATAAAKGIGRSVNDLGAKDVAAYVGKTGAGIGGGVGGVGTVLSAVVVLVRAYKKKKSGGELSPSDFNMLAQRTADAFDKSISAIKSTGDKLITKAEKKAAKNDSAVESFIATLESLKTDTGMEDAEWLAATEGANWQALKGVLGKKTRDARRFVKAAKAATKAGDKKTAISNLTQAKKMFGEVKSDLQKLPKDMWDTITSWLGLGFIQIVYVMAKGAKWDEQESKNVNVATVCTYLDGAMKKCDEKIAALRSGSATESVAPYMFE